MRARTHGADLTLALTTLLLVSAGLVLIYSTSAILAMGRMDDAYFFIKRQLLTLVPGCAALWAGFSGRKTMPVCTQAA